MKHNRLTAVLCLLLCLCFCMPAWAEETMTALEDGHYNIRFSNGYNGYCVDYGYHEAEENDVFIVAPVDVVKNNKSGKSVGNELKTYCAEYLDEFLKDKIKTQHVIYHFTDDFNGWRVDPAFIGEIRKTAAEKTIPDHGYSKKIDDRTTLFFDFLALVPKDRPRSQAFFVYKLSYLIEVDEGEAAVLPNPLDPENPTVIESPVNGQVEIITINDTPIEYTILVHSAPTPTPLPVPGVPATGDGAPLALLAALLMISGTLLIVCRRKARA